MEVALSPDLENKLSRLASQQGRESAALVVEAVERLVDFDAWFVSEVDKGLAHVDSSKTLSHEEVGGRMKKYLAAKLSPA
jgi:predicted transcriptional regulator